MHRAADVYSRMMLSKASLHQCPSCDQVDPRQLLRASKCSLLGLQVVHPIPSLDLLIKLVVQASQENASELERELELRRAELTRVTTVASRALHREASAIKEDGTVPFNQYKEEVR